jgi:hypothetical protein
VILVHNNFPGIVGEEQKWYLLQRLNSVRSRLLEMQSKPPQGHPALISVLEPILAAGMPRVAERFNCVIEEITHGTIFNRVNLLYAYNANLTHEDRNLSIDKPEYCWNILIVSSDTLSSRAKPSSNGQSPTVHAVLRFLMSPISMRLKTVWACKLR